MPGNRVGLQAERNADALFRQSCVIAQAEVPGRNCGRMDRNGSKGSTFSTRVLVSVLSTWSAISCKHCNFDFSLKNGVSSASARLIVGKVTNTEID